MTSLRERAQKQRQKGAEQRRDWNPDASSAHFKLYSWWLRQGGKAPTQENFCHYWRVVAIWAPLMWLSGPFRKPIVKKAIFTIALLSIAGMLLALALVHLSATMAILSVVLGLAYLMFGAYVVIFVASNVFDDSPPEDKKSELWKFFEGEDCWRVAPFVLLTLPVFLVVLVAVAILYALIGTGYWLLSEIGAFHWFMKAYPQKYPWLRPVTVTTALVLTALIAFAPFSDVAQGLLILIGTILGIMTMLIALAWLADYVKQQQAEQEQARQVELERRKLQAELIYKELLTQRYDRLCRAIFSVIHPRHAGSEYMYEQWKARYENFAYRPIETKSFDWHVQYVSERLIEKYGQEGFKRLSPYYIGEGMAALVMPSDDELLDTQPSVMTRALKATGDFLALAWAVMVAKKWGICPLVTLPSPASENS